MKKSFLILGWVVAFAMLLMAASTLVDLGTQVKGRLPMGSIPAGGSSAGFLRGDGSWSSTLSAFTVSNTFNLGGVTNYFTSTPASYSNECQSLVDSGGGTVTAVPVLRTLDNSNVAHDVLCLVTADTAFPATKVGTLVFAYPVGFGNNPVQASASSLEVTSKVSGGPVFILSNASGTGSRQNAINFRGCNGPLPGQACGTDLQFIEDPTGTGKEEYLFKLVGGNYPLYFGNRLNASHPGIYLGSVDASTSAYWGLDQVAGSLDHNVRLSANADMWGALTLVAGTASYNFSRSFASIPICDGLTWQGTGTLAGILKCVPTTSGITITSTVNTDTAVVAYEIKGNNN